MTASKLAQAKTANAELDRMSLFKSKVFVGALITLLATLAEYFGIVAAVTPEGREQVADLIVAAFQGGGALMAAIGRWAQKAAPKLKVL